MVCDRKSFIVNILILVVLNKFCNQKWVANSTNEKAELVIPPIPLVYAFTKSTKLFFALLDKECSL